MPICLQQLSSKDTIRVGQKSQILSWLTNQTLLMHFLNENYEGLRTYSEVKTVKSMFTKKNFEASIPIGIGYDMYGRPCTEEEKNLMTYKPPICNAGTIPDAKGFYCYSQCSAATTMWLFGPMFRNDSEVEEFLKLLGSGKFAFYFIC